MKKFLKVLGIIASWVLVTVLFPPLGIGILCIGLPVWVLMKIIKNDNPHLARKSKRRVVKTIILNTSQQASVGSTVGRAVVGDFVAGGFGAVVGAMTGKKKTITRFLVFFDDESQEVVDVPDGSILYGEYVNRLEMK
ncbi:MAG: hypothetical protein WHF31_16255 [Candidatus Dehalobacter alkaniphilus]